VHTLSLVVLGPQTGCVVVQGQNEISGDVLRTRQQLAHLQIETLLYEELKKVLEGGVFDAEQRTSREVVNDLFLGEFLEFLA